jgi:predicted DNA-binding transcriptional regulator AlpA
MSAKLRSPEDRFVTYDELPSFGVRYSRVHLRRLLVRGQFPHAHEITPNRIGWYLSDIQRWIASRPVRAVSAA